MDIGILFGVFNIVVGIYFFMILAKKVRKTPKNRFTDEQISKAIIFIRIIGVLIIFFGIIRLIFVVL